MVFESIVADILNRVVGEYVENLDKTQLKIGIWGGDVVLNDLVIKESILNELDLPLTITYARLGKLVLKIPWKEIYSAPAEALVERLYLLVVPNQSISFDEAKAKLQLEKWKKEQIAKYEQSKKATEEKPKLDKTFAERLVAQIINNVQIKIKDIHFRYEDTISHKVPFSIGATLSYLSIHTTNSDWQECLMTEMTSKVFKIAKLEGMALYLNPEAELFFQKDVNELRQLFKDSIATVSQKPADYSYILGPINVEAKLQLNSNPQLDEVPFSIPKIELCVSMQKLSLGFSKAQYRTIMQLIESLTRMIRGASYQKYRPNCKGYRGHYAEWWHFAYNCILNTEVQRKRKNWDWKNILNYRNSCREYARAYKEKLTAKRPPAELLIECENLELLLDMANIIQIRQKIEHEVKILDTVQENEPKGWFSGWFSSKRKESNEPAGDDIKSKFETAMTSEEKAKLYQAIGYEEDALPQEFPTYYVALKSTFNLNALELTIMNDDETSDSDTSKNVLFLQLRGVLCNLSQRPSASNIKLELQMNDFKVEGMRRDTFKPVLVSSDLDSSYTLLSLTFETNPVDKDCDQRLIVSSRPLQIVYDSVTILQLLTIFRTPTTTTMSKLQDVATEKLQNLKERSAIGLQYAISKHPKLELDIAIMPSYICIPYKGVYQGNEAVIIVNLGKFLVKTEQKSANQKADVQAMHKAGALQTEIMEQILSQSYDKYMFEMQNFQVVVAKPLDDWYKVIQSNEKTDLHLLEPSTLKLGFQLCVVDDDPRLPKVKILGEIPELSIHLSDDRLINIATILLSIPLPPEDESYELQPVTRSNRKSTSSLSLLKYFDDKNEPDLVEGMQPQTQFTNFEILFVLNGLNLIFDHVTETESCEIFSTPTEECASQQITESPKTPEKVVDSSKLISCNVRQVEFNLVQKTYETRVGLRLGAVFIDQHRNEGETSVINVITSPKFHTNDAFLFDLNYVGCQKHSPDFDSLYGSVEHAVVINFSTLLVVLHQEGILEVLKVINALVTKVMKITEQAPALVGKSKIVTQQEQVASTLMNLTKTRLPTIAEDETSTVVKSIIVDCIKFKITAKFENIAVELRTDVRPIASLEVNNFSTQIVVKSAYTDIRLILEDINVTEKNPDSVHKQILSIVGENALSCQVIIYNVDITSGYNMDNFKIEVSMGCAKIIFLNLFISSVLTFLGHFQAAQEKIISASAVAAEVARTNVVEAYTQATRVKLNIKVKAPIILIPIDSKSVEGLAIDLGFLSITNKCHVMRTNSQREAVIDEMNVDLKDMKLFRASNIQNLVDYRFDGTSNNQILLPTSFMLVLNRNLSSSWYNEQPDLNISGKIDTIELKVTSEDYKTMMQILEKNLGETSQFDEPPVLAAEPTAQYKESIERQLTKTTLTEGEQVAVKAFLKFRFELNNVVIHLFTNVDTGLATFGLNYLSLKGQKLADNCLTTSVVLCDIYLDDKRPSRGNKITRYIEKRKENESVDQTCRSMIDLTLTMKDNKLFADATVYSFSLILSIDFLLQISNFLSTDDGANKPSTSTVENKPSKVQQSKAKASTAVTPPQQNASKNIVLNIHIEQPDIILVESLDATNCHALILNNEIFIKFKDVDGNQNIKTEIKNFSLFVSDYDGTIQKTSRSNIISPCVIECITENSENHMDIKLSTSEVQINVSPFTIHLISTIVNTLTSKDQTLDESQLSETNYSTLWEETKFDENEFWFTFVDDSEEALLADTACVFKKTETCCVKIPSIFFMLESGLGIHTIPLINIESKMELEAQNWTSELQLNGNLNMLMWYYNNKLAVWEPLIEPIEKETPTGEFGTQWWELDFSLAVEGVNDENDSNESIKKISIAASDILETTLTKTSIEVLQNLSYAFSEAIKPSSLMQSDVSAPYVFFNNTGNSLFVNLTKTGFCLVGSEEQHENLLVQTSTSLHLQPSQSTFGSSLMSHKRQQNHNKYLYIKMDETSKELALPIEKADFRYFPLYRESKEPIAVISEVKVHVSYTSITVRGIVQIYNHFNTPITLLSKGEEYFVIGEIQGNSVFDVPLSATYMEKNDFYFAKQGYRPSAQGISWKESPGNQALSKNIQCDPIQTYEPFFINVTRQREEIFYEVTTKYTMTSASYVIHLRPPLTLRNALPIPITVSVLGSSFSKEKPVSDVSYIEQENSAKSSDYLDYGAKLVVPGESLHLPTVKTSFKSKDVQTYLVIKLNQYLEKDWSCTTEIQKNFEEFNVWTFTSYDSAEPVSMHLGIRYEIQDIGLILTLYCPFWFINKTGLFLSYRAADDQTNVLYHPPFFNQPIMFSCREKSFFGKKKATIKVANGDWCEKFSLDVAGSSGVIMCKNKDIVHQIAVRNILTSNSLTKQIVFMPYLMIFNRAPFTIEIQETHSDNNVWLKVPPNDCSPFWPKLDGNKTVRVKIEDSDEITEPFKYTEVQCTLLKLCNKYGGINVDVHSTEGAVYLTFTNYFSGDAPALIINDLDEPFTLWEKGNLNNRKINSKSKCFYTWVDPAGDRCLVWKNGSKHTIENDLKRDGIAPFKLETGDNAFWISFLDGMQRVLLFTQNTGIASVTQATTKFEKFTHDITISIHGVGLSLINNLTQKDVMYLGVASTAISWEEERKSRWKPLKPAESTDIEKNYQIWLDNKGLVTEVDFRNMTFKNKKIRRTFSPAVWLNIKMSPFQLHVHAKINRIQIDNQLSDCIYPVVLAPIPPPKSIALTEFKPFIEMSVVQRIIPHSTVKQFQYLRVLIQEFHVKVDLIFLNEIFDIFTSNITEEESKRKFLEDLKLQEQPLLAHATVQSQREQKHFYDNLHLSPLKIHVSFSMAGSESSALPPILSTILQGIGITLTDVNDVVFRLSYFQRECEFLTEPQLYSECISHYTSQALKQLYVLVLGLDVIGNPYGLVLGFTKGVEDLFYEPFQGAIQGPGEFAEGLVLGVKSLFGHTVGGAAGAVSKITGAVGKGIAALTFDKEYQKQRRDALNRKPENIQEGLARGGKGLVMGVFDGVTGVITKPISGAKSEGMEGFFKGLGKGAVGLIARPTAGFVDFASGSLDAVKRATDLSGETNKQRPSRFLRSDKIVRPYSRREGEGNKLLKEIDKGRFALSDTFEYLELQTKSAILLTNHRIIFGKKNELFGGWQAEWSCRWNEIEKIAQTSKGLEIVLKGSKESQSLKLFKRKETEKYNVYLENPLKKEPLFAILQKFVENSNQKET